MSVNASLPSPPPPPDIYSFIQRCMTFEAAAINMTALALVNLLFVLPLCLFVFLLGVQRWRRRPDAAVSHTDFFTYHMMVVELAPVLGSVLASGGAFARLTPLITLGVCLFVINLSSQVIYHVLTCVDRYLAVVHPVAYRNLSQTAGRRIRYACVGGVWLLSSLWIWSSFLVGNAIITSMCIFLTFAAISFCSVSVLRALIRPQPGAGEGGAKPKRDPAKLRAFHTIVAIKGALLLRLAGNMMSTAAFMLPQLQEREKCYFWFFMLWFNLPSSFILPLLYLHRAGKLARRKDATKK
ncbi:uncharacterized protein V6R79_019751 [Siganus canaliculatus]